MDYLKKKDEKSYLSLTKKLGLKRNRAIADTPLADPLQKGGQAEK